jgi:multiple sugar transport system substrate-binding protein
MGMGILPSRSSDLQVHQSQLNSPFISTYVEQLPKSIPFPIVLGGDEITTSLQKSLESVMFGQNSPQQGMAQAQSNLSQILSQYYS